MVLLLWFEKYVDRSIVYWTTVFGSLEIKFCDFRPGSGHNQEKMEATRWFCFCGLKNMSTNRSSRRNSLLNEVNFLKLKTAHVQSILSNVYIKSFIV